MRRFDTIIIHASATPPDWMKGKGAKAKRDEIDRWHRERGFNSVGYHYIIDRDGKIATGRHLNKTGAHVKGHNTGSVGVCLIGGRWPHGPWGLATDDFADHFTPEQDAALRSLITDLCERYPAIQHIKGHNDFTNNKGCPGFKVGKWLRENSSAQIPQNAPLPQHRKPSPLRLLFQTILKMFGGQK